MSRILSTLGATAIACGLSIGAALAQTPHGAHGTAPMEGASAAYMDAMTRMNDDMAAMRMTGKPGADFALMMIPHHQSAIDMARAYLESGEGDAELVRLTRDIIAAQEGEIAFLKAWLEKSGR